ncbi:MAG TPA: peptide chain release factor N(5)-glutamine methyltransferase [Longimicrobiales bacterium]|nr:peptide chain release factor N(5)-glutamine methyltransferase [Longimicrobiales bacterium]
MSTAPAARVPEPAPMSDDRTPLTVARLAAEHLKARGVPDPRLDAELLLAAALGVRRLDLYLQHDRPLTDDELEPYREMIRRRARREPLQYITGSVAFREIELRVDRRALIPRPETEILVGVVLDWSRARASSATAPLRALDIGTGTGVIALSLLAEGGFGTVVATDASADALALAAENAAALGLTERLELRHGSLYEPLRPDERFDAVVSNPPYISTATRAVLAPEVIDWEPAAALFAGAAGLDLVEPIVRQAAERLARRGLLALELAETQALEVAELARVSGFDEVRIIEDLTGRARIVAAERV